MREADVRGTEALDRSLLWAAVAALFRYPTEEAAADLRSPSLWASAARGAGRLADPRLASAVARARASFEGLQRDALEAAHVRAFGHTVRSPAPPYETLWGSEGSLLQPHTIADLAAFYRAHGLRIAPGGERADHLAVECEFLQFLAYKEGYALARGEEGHAAACREARAGFLRAHLGRFGPAFVARLRQEAGGGPFAEAAGLLAALLQSEAESLGVTTGAEDLPQRTISFEDEASCVRCPLAPGAAAPPG